MGKFLRVSKGYICRYPNWRCASKAKYFHLGIKSIYKFISGVSCQYFILPCLGWLLFKKWMALGFDFRWFNLWLLFVNAVWKIYLHICNFLSERNGCWGNRIFLQHWFVDVFSILSASGVYLGLIIIFLEYPFIWAAESRHPRLFSD